MRTDSEKLLLPPPSATSAASAAVNAADSSINQSAESILPAHNEPLIDGQRFRANQLVMAIDLREKIHNWYEAHIVEVCKATRRYLVHFKGFNKRYDQWKSFDDTTSLKNLPDNSIRFLKAKTSSLNSSSLSSAKKKPNLVPEEVPYSAPSLSLDVSEEDLLKSDKKLTRKRFTDSVFLVLQEILINFYIQFNESSSPYKNKMSKKEPIGENNSKISPSNIQKIMSRETSYNSTKIPDSGPTLRPNKENNTSNDRKLQKKPKIDTKNSIAPVDIPEAKTTLSFGKNDSMSVANPVQNLKPLVSRSSVKNQSSSKIPHLPKNEKIDINEIKIDCVCQK
ncbi:MAG: PHD finger protein 20, partial [Marteilia pararefringens]